MRRSDAVPDPDTDVKQDLVRREHDTRRGVRVWVPIAAVLAIGLAIYAVIVGQSAISATRSAQAGQSVASQLAQACATVAVQRNPGLCAQASEVATSAPTATGPAGPVGPAGADGADGATVTGPPGPQGAPGVSVTGPPGRDGTNGRDGQDGANGADGATVTGPQGPPGVTVTGPAGVAGPQGETGAAGQPPYSWTWTDELGEHSCVRTDPFDPAQPTYTCS